jgi:hypothetical protein
MTVTGRRRDVSVDHTMEHVGHASPTVVIVHEQLLVLGATGAIPELCPTTGA